MGNMDVAHHHAIYSSRVVLRQPVVFSLCLEGLVKEKIKRLRCKNEILLDVDDVT